LGDGGHSEQNIQWLIQLTGKGEVECTAGQATTATEEKQEIDAEIKVCHGILRGGGGRLWLGTRSEDLTAVPAVVGTALLMIADGTAIPIVPQGVGRDGNLIPSCTYDTGNMIDHMSASITPPGMGGCFFYRTSGLFGATDVTKLRIVIQTNTAFFTKQDKNPLSIGNYVFIITAFAAFVNLKSCENERAEKR